MGRKAGWHAVNDTGSMTGVATAILALLSAGTVASITLVGVHQLAPAVSERLHAGEPAAVRAPVTVVVTPRAPAAAPGSENTVQRSASKPRTPKPRLSSPSDATVVPAVLTSPASPVSTRSPRVTLPPVHVHRPAVTIPAVTVPAVTIPAVIALAVTVPAVPTLLAVVPVAPTFTVGPPVSVLPQPGFPQGSSSGHGHGGPDGSGSGHDGDGSGHDGGGSGHDGDGSGHDGDGSGHDGDGH